MLLIKTEMWGTGISLSGSMSIFLAYTNNGWHQDDQENADCVVSANVQQLLYSDGNLNSEKC